MKKTLGIIVGVSIFLGIVCAPIAVQAVPKATSSVSMQELIESLQEKIEALRARIQELQGELKSLGEIKKETKQEVKEFKEALRVTKQLRKGMTGEDVTLLQEFLATDPEIYPEGLVTGYFGRLTEQAVKRLQKLAGLEQVGNVGPKTLSKINELLEEGAGNSGKVPPGLLIAPGIRKKIGYTPTVPSCQDLPPGIAKKICEEEGEEEEEEEPEEGCINSGGTVATSTCCLSTDDFPNTCLIGACGCAPGSSHEINICDCGADKCFNGEECEDIAEEDTIPPEISGVMATSTTATTTDITWTTNEESDSKVWYGTATPLVAGTSTASLSDASLVTDHALTLIDLTASTAYYYLVTSVDTAGNNTTSTEYSFITLSE